MNPRTFAVIIGVCLIAAGLFAGLHSSTVTVGNRAVNCGSGFAPNTVEIAAADRTLELLGSLSVRGPKTTGAATTACATSAGTIGWVLIAVGAITVIGGLVIRTGDRKPTGTRWAT